MYLKNKYTKWYYNIINNAKIRILEKEIYTEKHHIIPRSLKGNDLEENKVILTAREHFICHLLLPKMVEGKSRSKMVLAIMAMCRKSEGQERYIPNSAQYEIIRKIINKNLSGEGSPTYGRKRPAEEQERINKAKAAGRLTRPKYIVSEETRRKISKNNTGRSPSQATRDEWSRKRKGRPGLNNNQNKRWFNDGVKSYLRLTCPPGCVLGRLPLK